MLGQWMCLFFSRHCSSVWLLLIAAALAAAIPARAADDLILKLDLRSLGATGLEVAADQPDRPVYSGHLNFFDDSTLAISFPIFNPVLKLSTREHPTGGSMLLHTAVIDLTNGHTRMQRSWGNAGKTDVIAAGPRLVLVSDRRVEIVSRDLEPVRAYRYALNTPYRLRTSETGNTLFLITREDHDELVQVLDPAGHRPSYSFRAPFEEHDAFSDTNFAFTRVEGKTSEIVRVSLDDLRRGTAELRPLPYRPEGRCTDPYFVTDNVLVIGGVCEHMTVLASDGTIQEQQQVSTATFFSLAGRIQIPEVNYLAGFVASRDESRFAVVLRNAEGQKRKGELPAAEYRARSLAVYDTSGTLIFQTPVPQPEKGTFAIDQAISPDGSVVALLVGWNVWVYRVPETPK